MPVCCFRALGLLSSEVGRYFAPARRVPFQNRNVGIVVGAEPVFGTFDELVQLFSAGIARQGGAAFASLDPQHGIAAVRIDGALYALLFE